VLLIASVLSTAYSWNHSCGDYPQAALCDFDELLPAGLSFPLLFVLPRSWPTWAGFSASVGFAAVSSMIAWLLIRRFAPQRIKLWHFLASLVVWPAISFAVTYGVMVGGALVWKYTHGG
jgi:predicted membrane channel-forming protein YqfA (hemolysin III family)